MVWDPDVGFIHFSKSAARCNRPPTRITGIPLPGGPRTADRSSALAVAGRRADFAPGPGSASSTAFNHRRALRVPASISRSSWHGIPLWPPFLEFHGPASKVRICVIEAEERRKGERVRARKSLYPSNRTRFGWPTGSPGAAWSSSAATGASWCLGVWNPWAPVAGQTLRLCALASSSSLRGMLRLPVIKCEFRGYLCQRHGVVVARRARDGR